MAESESDLVARITERLRKDHPQKEMRAEYLTEDKLLPYVRTLINDESVADDLVKRVASAVRAAS
jgi:hypothetical protein